MGRRRRAVEDDDDLVGRAALAQGRRDGALEGRGLRAARRDDDAHALMGDAQGRHRLLEGRHRERARIADEAGGGGCTSTRRAADGGACH